MHWLTGKYGSLNHELYFTIFFCRNNSYLFTQLPSLSEKGLSVRNLPVTIMMARTRSTNQNLFFKTQDLFLTTMLSVIFVTNLPPLIYFCRYLRQIQSSASPLFVSPSREINFHDFSFTIQTISHLITCNKQRPKKNVVYHATQHIHHWGRTLEKIKWKKKDWLGPVT